MRIADILRTKGSFVATVRPSTTVTQLLAEFASHNAGAMVVVENDRVIGIVSERDVVRELALRGAELLPMLVSEIMTADVSTCDPQDSIEQLSWSMTEGRFRHVPVLSDGELVGIVSIGDVVKSRINQLKEDRDQLEDYITG